LIKIKTVSQHTKSKPVPIFQDQLAIDPITYKFVTQRKSCIHHVNMLILT